MEPVGKECKHWREMLELEGSDHSLVHSQAHTQDSAALREHLKQCASCRAYAQTLQALRTDLHRLSESPVKPSAHLHARWTAAVRAEAKPTEPQFAEALVSLLQHLRLAIGRNLKPLAVLSPIWLLILAFKVTAPPTAGDSAVPAQSPVAIVRLLKLEQLETLAMGAGGAEIKRQGPSTLRPRSHRGVPTRAPHALTGPDSEATQVVGFTNKNSSHCACV